MTDVEAVNDVTREVLNHFKAVIGNGTAVVEHEDQVDTEALGAALFQLTARLDEAGHVAVSVVVRPPEVGLSLDVARDAVLVVAGLKKVGLCTVTGARCVISSFQGHNEFISRYQSAMLLVQDIF